MRIAIDAMGGDNAPGEIISGALEAKDLLSSHDELVMVGDEQIIRTHLRELKAAEDTFRIFHAPEVIGMDESPVDALRKKTKSSIAVMSRLASHKQVDAILSAGNTGACVAGAQLRIRTLEGVVRPGIAVVMPTYSGPITMCDVGANISCKPIHLYQYAVMASVYSNLMLGVTNPRVGIMNIGEEEAKGTDLIKKTRAMLKSDSNINFVGNIEGRDIFEGKADIVICEGFVGNVVLKLTEGAVSMLFQVIKSELVNRSTLLKPWNILLSWWFKSVIKEIYKKYDYHEYGGALLLGVDGTAMICHGSSKARTIKNAIMACKRTSEKKINEHIVQALAKSTVTNNGD
jgi:glycerol-3-phosphate acyltransferase PlsX